jgi:hypothetical protein
MKYKREVLRHFEHCEQGQLVAILVKDSKLPDIGWVEKKEIDDMVDGFKITIRSKEFGGFIEIPLTIIQSWEVLPDLEKEPPQQLHLFAQEQLLLPL